MQSSAELDLVSVTGQRDVLQWGIRNFTRIQQVGDISYIGVDDAIFYVDEKGVRIVEGGIYVQVSTRHLAAKPPDINAKVRAVPQHQIVSINPGRRRIRSIAVLLRTG